MEQNPWDKKCVIAPSLISVGDFCNLQRCVEEMEAAGAQILHIDILDGYFSPSFPLGFNAVAALRKVSKMKFDVHLMVEHPDFFIQQLLDIGVDQIVFHAETEKHIDNQLNRIIRAGVRAGVALKPATALSVLEYVLPKCDSVLLMLINPGYAGDASESQVPYAQRKVKELRRMIDSRGLATKIILDGRISKENIAALGGRYGNIFVAGSTCLDKNNLGASIREMVDFAAKKGDENG